MGKVIALPLARKITTDHVDGGSAEILFFTGVRYHRMSDEEFARLAAPSSQRRLKSKPAAPARKLRKLA